MGLGFFIAKTLLERSGASVTLANRKSDGRGGAMVKIAWPRAGDRGAITPGAEVAAPRAMARGTIDAGVICDRRELRLPR